MSRVLSTEVWADITAQETGEVYAILLLIEHPELDAPIRVNNTGADITSGGELFIAFPYEITLPDDVDGAPSRARLIIDNVDRSIVVAVRQLSTAPNVTMRIVRVSAPDAIEAEFPDFKFTNITYDEMTVQGDLTLEDFTTEPFPALTFSPSLFGGLY